MKEISNTMSLRGLANITGLTPLPTKAKSSTDFVTVWAPTLRQQEKLFTPAHGQRDFDQATELYNLNQGK